jgi:16S rRNA processing protein RimM
VEVGVLRGAYGLHGWSHVQAHSGDPRVLQRVRQWWLLGPRAGAGGQPASQGPVKITAVRPQGAGFVAKWNGCEDPEAAQALKGWRVAVSRSRFPPLAKGEFYWVDLIGAQAVNRSGLVLGTVSGLRNNGAHDLLEIERAQGSQLLIPVVADYVDEIDVPGRTIRVDWDPSW